MTQGWLRVALLAGLAGGWSGCFFDADYRRTRYQCGDGACPSDYTCRGDRCEPRSSGVVPGELEGCGTTAMLDNTFEGASLDTAHWFIGGNLQITQQDGRLQIVNGNPDDYTYGGYESQRAYLLRDTGVSVEVPDYDPATGGNLALVIETATAVEAMFELNPGELVLRYALMGDRFMLAKLAYDPEEHRFWQIREAEGTMYWETSPDGVAWTILASTSSLPFHDVARVRLVAGMPGGAGPVFFDTLKGTGATGDVSWCAADTLRDDFEDGLIGTAWTPWGNDICTFFERDGRLEFEFAPEGDASCGFDSKTRYDLTGGTVTVEVPKVDESGKIHTWFTLDFANGNWIALSHGNTGEQETNRLVCRNQIRNAMATPCSLSYEPAEHRWWRFRHDRGANVVHWETSPNGKQWTSHASYGAGDFSFDGAAIAFYSESYGAGVRTNSGIAYDNLNVTPE
jgi:hypothetical protein